MVPEHKEHVIFEVFTIFLGGLIMEGCTTVALNTSIGSRHEKVDGRDTLPALMHDAGLEMTL